MKFTGKKLLMLGSNVGSAEIVKYAKKNGAYVYAADFFPIEKSEAKKEADEALLISTADIEALSDIITKNQIDAVISGISGFNITKAIELSARHGLTHYCTMEQWEALEHKNHFRALCDKFAVPCPKTYFTGCDQTQIPWDEIQYPVVVKPVDSGASLGVHICDNRAVLEEKILDAVKHSDSSTIILEQFVYGTEFTAHYSIFKGKAVLSCVDNRYPVAVHEGNVTTIPIARTYPSTFIDSYIQQVNDSMLHLIESVGIQNGVVFIQGMHNPENDSFSIFEAGARSAACIPCRIIEKINGNHYLKMMVDCALGIESDFDLSKEDPYMHGKYCGTISFVAKGGVVGSIDGLEESVAKVPSVIAYESRYPVGSTTPNGDTLHQLMLRFVMVCENREQMEHDIQYLNDHIIVKDTEGNDLVIKMNPERIYGEI